MQFAHTFVILLFRRLGHLARCLSIILLAAGPLTAWATDKPFALDIAASDLATALNTLALNTGAVIYFDAALTQDKQSPGIRGEYHVAAALTELLQDVDLQAERETDGSYRVVANDTGGEAEAAPESLPRLSVAGEGAEETGAARDLRLKDEIFDQDISTDYLGKEDIDRFRGISTADVFQGLTNVYSGAARNGGALDANIRGIQGAGRAPVIIDGTEQAIVVNRGYRGAGNRSYIDPSLIAGVQALKGPVSVREINSQSGGAIAIRTLGANDILRPGERFGVELRLEAGNNATAPRLPTLRTGQDAHTVPGFLDVPADAPTYDPYSYPSLDPTLRVQPRTKDDNDPFAFGGDRAARIAAAGRKGDFDFFGAYAYRSRGNYFSGKNNADFYADKDAYDASIFRMRQMAFAYRPGNEVTNSSSEMRSWLFKSTWRVADDQALQLGYRNTRTATGEIMPLRVRPVEDVRKRVRSDQKLGDIQWPLSRTRIDALNLEYKYAPETPWLDVHANLWTTRARSNTYSSGGFPNVPISRTDTTLINTALNNSRNNRWGVTFSNKMALLPSVDLTVGGHYQYEKLRSDDEPLPKEHISFSTAGREGNRQEYRANIQLEWRPTRFLTFNGGVGHAGYRSFDDGLNARLKRGPVDQKIRVGKREGYRLYAKGSDAYRAFNPPRYAALLKLYQDAARRYEKDMSGLGRFLYGFYTRRINRIQSGNDAREYEERAQRAETVPFPVGDFTREWRADASGKFRRANMPPGCGRAAPGDFDLAAVSKEIAADTKRQPFVGNKILNPDVRQGISEVGCSNNTEFIKPRTKTIELKSPADNPVWRASGWEPYLTATLKLSEDIRVYGRYAERLRFPSVFESTSGFSADVNLARPLKPERIHAWEGPISRISARCLALRARTSARISSWSISTTRSGM